MRQITHQNEAAGAAGSSAAESFWFEGAGGDAGGRIDVAAAPFRCVEEISDAASDSRRPAGGCGRRVGISLERAVMAAPGYVVVMINPRGSFGYGAKIHGRDQPRLGRESLRRFDERRGRGDREVSVYRRDAVGGGRRLVRRVHGGLDCHAYGPVQMPDQPCGTLRYGEHVRGDREFWFMDWEFGGPPWANPELYKKWSPSEYAAAWENSRLRLW